MGALWLVVAVGLNAAPVQAHQAVIVAPTSYAVQAPHHHFKHLKWVYCVATPDTITFNSDGSITSSGSPATLVCP